MVELPENGWMRFEDDPAIHSWISQARTAAKIAINDPKNAKWSRCGGTWFAGVNVLANGPNGSVAGSGPLAGQAISFANKMTGASHVWDRAQISVVTPGYPQQGDESDVAFAYRCNRDAAHVDGLLPIGPDRMRMLRDPHAFVLGIPLTKTSAGASPLVVWEGSHKLMQRAFRNAFQDIAPDNWYNVDLTKIYQRTRKECFATCKRIELHANPGQATLIHRLALHGVAPWQKGAIAPPEGRMIAYFRPTLGDVSDWLG